MGLFRKSRVVRVTAVSCFAAIAAAGGCASVYYPPEGWARGYDSTLYPSQEAVAAAVAQDRNRFRSDLVDCVTARDPAHLRELDDGRTYRLTGWFVPARRFGKGSVRDCLIGKGWQPAPQ